MGSTSLTAASVMDSSASLMNDTAKTVYTYVAQIPYLNMALIELSGHFQLNNIPVTNETSAAITIPIGTTEICAFDGVGAGPLPHYPQDLIEIQELGERTSGSGDKFSPVSKRESLSNLTPSDVIRIWAWEGQKIKFAAVTAVREVELKYIKTLFLKVTNQAQVLGVIDAEAFLYYKTAALCSMFIGENESRAEALNGLAIQALDTALGIGTKSKQNIVTRRKPFMSSYKRRSM